MASAQIAGVWRMRSFCASAPSDVCPGWEVQMTAATITADEIMRYRNAGADWKVELVCDTDGHDKFYRVEPVAPTGSGPDKARLTWGRNGTNGQSQVVTLAEARERIAEKLGKGYRYRTSTLPSPGRPPIPTDRPRVRTDGRTAPAPQPERVSLRDGCGRATFRMASREDLYSLAASEGWRKVELEDPTAIDVFREAEELLQYVGRDGARWVVVRQRDGKLLFGKIDRRA
jgi:predicted DNA-binding WGR domain protein